MNEYDCYKSIWGDLIYCVPFYTSSTALLLKAPRKFLFEVDLYKEVHNNPSLLNGGE